MIDFTYIPIDIGISLGITLYRYTIGKYRPAVWNAWICHKVMMELFINIVVLVTMDAFFGMWGAVVHGAEIWLR